MKDQSQNAKGVRIALIGCGAISGTHIEGLLATGGSIVGLCDILLDHAQAKKERYNLNDAQVFENYKEMLVTLKPDVVHICTPHYLHAEMICFALKQGIAVLCEKPVCITLEELDTIEKTLDETHGRLGVCFQNRYLDPMRFMKEQLSSSIVSAYGTVVWKRDDAYYASGDWRGKIATEGGGVLINQAIHTLDLLLWVCGTPVTLSSSISNWTHQKSIDVEDHAMLYFVTNRGVTVQFFATTSSMADFPITVNLKTSDGKLYHLENDMIICDGHPQVLKVEDPYPGKAVWGVGHKLLIADYYLALKEHRPFAIGLDEARKIVELLNWIYKDRK